MITVPLRTIVLASILASVVGFPSGSQAQHQSLCQAWGALAEKVAADRATFSFEAHAHFLLTHGGGAPTMRAGTARLLHLAYVTHKDAPPLVVRAIVEQDCLNDPAPWVGNQPPRD